MKIIDKERFFTCLMVLVILIGLYVAIGTIERRQGIPEELRQVAKIVEDKPDQKMLPPTKADILTWSSNQKENTLHL